ncbi:MAG TPA: pyruvate kinase [Bryobacteraceae bacterium]|nr:pyruvate kinase [Bryobacteraceae bacterium]
MANTKIVATLGPATDSPSAIRQLLQAGVDVFRLNASHSTQAEHAARIAAIRQVAAESGLPAAILLDLQGPKIRREWLRLRRLPRTITAERAAGDCGRPRRTYTNL